MYCLFVKTYANEERGGFFSLNQYREMYREAKEVEIVEVGTAPKAIREAVARLNNFATRASEVPKEPSPTAKIISASRLDGGRSSNSPALP